MFIKTLKVVKEAYFDIEQPAWIAGKAQTDDIYRPCYSVEVLINSDHIIAAYPVEYKGGMSPATPTRNAADHWLNNQEGTKVILVTGTSFTVTAKLHELEAAIGTQHPIDVA